MNNMKLDSIKMHDARIYALAFDQYQLLFDIDIILNRKLNVDSCNFEIASSTLVFNNVWNVTCDLDTNLKLIVDDIHIISLQELRNIDFLDKSALEYRVQFDCLEGLIEFNTIGGMIYLRNIVKSNQSDLSLKERMGFSLNKIGDSHKILFYN